MMKRPKHIAPLLVLVTACGFPQPKDVPGDGTSQGPDVPDQPVGPDAPPATEPRCDPTKPFDKPTLLEGINSTLDERSFSLTRDEKTGFLTRRAGDVGTILVTTCSSTDAEFSVPSANLTSAINAVGSMWWNSPAADGLSLYYERQTGTQHDVLVSSWPDSEGSFDAGALVTADGDTLVGSYNPALSSDGQSFYWGDSSFSDIYVATRFGVASFRNTRLVASAIRSQVTVLSADELTKYSYKVIFGSNTVVDAGEVIVSTRSDTTQQFGEETLLSPAITAVNSPSAEIPVAITRDGCVLYISSDRPGGKGGFDIWEARRPR
jgi:hypothetical protein